MKQIPISLILISNFFFICVSHATDITNFNSVTIFSFNTSCMQKYNYQVDREFILDDNHTAYHIHLDNERTLVLKVMKRDESVQQINSNLTIVYDCTSSKGIQPNFVVDINNGNSPVFIAENGTYYKVSLAEYNVDNDAFFSSFAPPDHSLVYQYDNTYDPLETLRPAGLEALDYETRNFYYSTEQERSEQQFVYLQIYRDACANRPYGIVTPLSGLGNENPFKYAETTSANRSLENSTTSKQIYRSCQHPVEVKHIKSVGMAQRSYIEDDKVYMSKLVSIDGKPLAKYLEANRNFNSGNTNKSADLTESISWEYDLTKVETNPKYVPKYIVGSPKNGAISTPKGNTTRTITLNVPTEYNTKSTASPSLNESTTLSVPTVSLSGTKHIVEQGETLYSISKKYGVFVLDIKINNHLSDNTIEIGQELIIGN
jgi:hypothetical protein